MEATIEKYRHLGNDLKGEGDGKLDAMVRTYAEKSIF